MIVAMTAHGSASKALILNENDFERISVMKKLSARIAAVLFAFAILSMAPALTAQNGMGGENPDKAEMMEKLQKMSTELQLSPSQKQQMAPILMEEATQLKGVKANTSLPPMQKAMKMRQIANTADGKVKPILNPQQYEKWEQIRAQERKQMMEKMEQ